MDKEKEIEEMASVLERAKINARATIGSLNKGFGYWYAESLANAGYGNVKKYQDQINDLQAEIEYLKQENRYWYGQAQRQYQEYKAGYSKQAVKEFAEELKDQCRINSDIGGGCGGYCVAPFEIDNLFKKLYGED